MPNSKVDARYDFNPEKWVISLINTKGGTGGLIGGHAKIIVEGQRQRLVQGQFQPAPELCIAEFHIYDAGGAVAMGDSQIPQFLRNTQSNYAVLTSMRYEAKMRTTDEWEAIETLDAGDLLLRQAEHGLEYKVLSDSTVYTGVIHDADLNPDYAPGTMIQMIQDNGLEPMKWALLAVTATRGHTQPTDEDDVFKTIYKTEKERQYVDSSSRSWHVTPDAAITMIRDILDEKHGRGHYEGLAKPFQYAGMWCMYSYRGGHNCTTWAEEKLEKAGIGSGVILTDSSKAMPQVHVSCSLL
jgi:hypothetical protein